MDKQREMFEAWYQQSSFAGRHRGFADYKHFAYAAWQAAIAAQQSEPRCACGDSFTGDAACANCLAAEWEPTK